MDFEGSYRDVLAVGQYARPRFRQPVKLLSHSRGNSEQVWEVEEDDDDFNIFEDLSEEGYFDEEFPSKEYSENPTQLQVMEADKNQVKTDHFDDMENDATNLDELEKFMENVNDEGTVKKLVVKAGNGFKVPERCRIFFNYTATAEGTYEPYDWSKSQKYPCSVDLREEAAILPGVEIAVRSMEIGEKSRFVIDPSLAFGPLGCPPRIPPNVRILFNCTTLQYIDEARLNTPLYMSKEQRNGLPYKEILDFCIGLRTDGNGLYNSKEQFNIRLAIKKWRKSIQILEEYTNVDYGMELEYLENLHLLYANVAQAYLILEKPAQACAACKIGLKQVEAMELAVTEEESKEQNIEGFKIKLLFRFAKAKLMLKDSDAALGLVEKGLKIDRDHFDLKKLKREILAEHQKQLKTLNKMWSGGMQKFCGSSQNQSSPKALISPGTEKMNQAIPNQTDDKPPSKAPTNSNGTKINQAIPSKTNDKPPSKAPSNSNGTKSNQAIPSKTNDKPPSKAPSNSNGTKSNQAIPTKTNDKPPSKVPTNSSGAKTYQPGLNKMKNKPASQGPINPNGAKNNQAVQIRTSNKPPSKISINSNAGQNVQAGPNKTISTISSSTAPNLMSSRNLNDSKKIYGPDVHTHSEMLDATKIRAKNEGMEGVSRKKVVPPVTPCESRLSSGSLSPTMLNVSETTENTFQTFSSSFFLTTQDDD